MIPKRGARLNNTQMTCSICDSRKAKRHCPALGSQICGPCCGQGREETIGCPLNCRYLEEGREFERRAGLAPENFPHKEIEITDRFLREQVKLLEWTAVIVLRVALNTPGAVDRDVREALDALVRTYKSLQSGIHYETRPESPAGQAIAAQMKPMLVQVPQPQAKVAGYTLTRDSDVIRVLVFLLRMALDHDNGRSRGRSFLHLLQFHFPHREAPVSGSSLIVPG